MSETGIDVMSSGDESDAEPMYMDMLEDIRVRSQSNPSINRREAHYKTSDCFKQSRPEWKGALLSMQNMGKGLQKLLRLLLMKFQKHYQFLVNQSQKFLTSFQNLEIFQKQPDYQKTPGNIG